MGIGIWKCCSCRKRWTYFWILSFFCRGWICPKLENLQPHVQSKLFTRFKKTELWSEQHSISNRFPISAHGARWSGTRRDKLSAHYHFSGENREFWFVFLICCELSQSEQSNDRNARAQTKTNSSIISCNLESMFKLPESKVIQCSMIKRKYCHSIFSSFGQRRLERIRGIRKCFNQKVWSRRIIICHYWTNVLNISFDFVQKTQISISNRIFRTIITILCYSFWSLIRSNCIRNVGSSKWSSKLVLQFIRHFTCSIWSLPRGFWNLHSTWYYQLLKNFNRKKNLRGLKFHQNLFIHSQFLWQILLLKISTHYISHLKIRSSLEWKSQSSHFMQLWWFVHY